MSSRNLEYSVRARDVPIDLFPGQRIRFSLGTSHRPTARRYREALNDLRREGAYDVLRAIQDSVVSVSEVFYLLKRGDMSRLQALQEIRDRIASRREVSGLPTFAEQVETYIAWCARKRAANTVRSKAPALRRLARELVRSGGPLGDLVLTKVTSHDLDLALSRIGQPSYQNTVRTYVSGMYTRAIKDEAERARVEGRAPRIVANPARGVEIVVDRDPEEITILSRAEVIRLLECAEPYQLAYVLPMLHVGFRLDEVIHTRLGRDLDVENWVWRIQKHEIDRSICGCASCEVHGWKPKGRNSYRNLEIPRHPPELRQALEQYLALYPCKEGDYLFRNPRTGALWRKWSITADFQSLCDAAGVKYGRKVQGGITIHSLRHTCATNLIRAGVRESVVAAILGDSVDVVVEYYVHLDPSDLGAGISRSPAYLDSGDCPHSCPQVKPALARTA